MKFCCIFRTGNKQIRCAKYRGFFTGKESSITLKRIVKVHKATNIFRMMEMTRAKNPPYIVNI